MKNLILNSIAQVWGTVENQSDHRGAKHVGVLFYLYHGGAHLNWLLGLIHWYLSTINDNNHHLIVTKDK